MPARISALRPLLPALGFVLAVIAIFTYDLPLHGKVLFPSAFLRNRAPFSSAAPSPPAFSRRRLHGDTVTATVPLRAFASEEWSHGRVPTWVPWELGGAPFLNDLTAPFFPPAVATSVLPIAGQLTFDAIVRMMIAGAGMVLLLRRWNLGPEAQATGAVAYTFCYMMTFWLSWAVENVTAMLPWMILAVESVLDAPRGRSLALLAAVAALSILGGNVEANAHMWTGTGLFFVVRLAQRAYAREIAPRVAGITAFVALGGVVLGAIVAGIHLVPFFEILGRSAIWTDRPAVGVGGVPFGGLRLWLAPDAFGYLSYTSDPSPSPRFDASAFEGGMMNAYAGLATLALVPAAFFSPTRRRLATALATLSLVVAACVYGVPGFRQLIAVIPVLSHTYLERMLFLPAFGISALAAIGVETIVTDRNARARRATIVATATLAVASIVALAQTAAPYPIARGWAPVAAAIAAGAAVLVVARERAASWLFPGVVALELFAVLGGFNEWTSPSEVLPRSAEVAPLLAETGGFLGVYDGIYPPMLSLRYGIRDLRAYDPMVSRRWRRFYDRLDPSTTHENPAFLFMLTPDMEWARIAGVDRFALGAAPSPQAGWIQSRKNPATAPIAAHGTGFRQTISCTRGTALDVQIAIGHARGEIHVLDGAGQPVAILAIGQLQPGLVLARFEKGAPCPATFTIEIQATEPVDLPSWPRAADDPDGALFVDGAPSTGQMFAMIGSHPFHAATVTWADPLAILHDPAARPFVWLAERTLAAPDSDAALDAIANEISASDRWAVLEGPAAEPATPLEQGEVVAWTRPSPTRISVDATAVRPRWLVVQESNDPGWIATVDGARAPLVPANSVFQAVHLPEGRHHVELVYAPRSLRWGALLSLLGILVTGIAWRRAP